MPLVAALAICWPVRSCGAISKRISNHLLLECRRRHRGLSHLLELTSFHRSMAAARICRVEKVMIDSRSAPVGCRSR